MQNRVKNFQKEKYAPETISFSSATFQSVHDNQLANLTILNNLVSGAYLSFNEARR